MSQKANRFDLEERTAKFGEAVIALCQQIQKEFVTQPIVASWYALLPVSAQIIWKQMAQVLKRTSETKYIFVKRNPKRPSTG